jgi:BlaI family transcriptional regulator, penicillinase repressor
MQKLTRAEEEVMQRIWKRGRCTVSDLLDDIEHDTGERPPHSSIATLVQILHKKKNFLGHKAYGKTYEYFPVVPKEDYGRRNLTSLISDYFDGSVSALVSHLAADEKLDAAELRELLDKLDGK